MPSKPSQNKFIFGSIAPTESSFGTLSWLRRIASRRSISMKIGCGYALAFSIAVLGTVAGLFVGTYYEMKFDRESEQWHETGVLVNKLQVAVLQVRSQQQQLTSVIQYPQRFQKEYSEFFKYIDKLKILLSEAKALEKNVKMKELNQFIQNYDNLAETYFQETDKLVKQIDPVNLKREELLEAEQILLNFTDSEIALKFDGLSEELSEIGAAAFEEEEKVHAVRDRVEIMQVGIPIVSILLSVIVAIILAFYTSRAIDRSLKNTTEIAQRVIEDANFELQVPVTTKDEIGILANSLNQLIERVKNLLEEQKATQEVQLLQSEKMSSLGRMVAGVAHEINNPVNFIYGNIGHASDYVEDLLSLIQTYRTEIPNPPLNVQAQAEEIEVDFLAEDLPKVLRSMKVGADRVRQIVISLKDFSRLDEADVHPVDLHACIESTLLILYNRIKKGIQVVRNYGDIPAIEGYAGFLYQVFMNLLSNAIDALEEVETQEKQQQIIITTERQDKDWILVRIADSGSGISPENHVKIFDTFFTTKPRGIGTGLGLAITRQIVEEKHGGKINFTSGVGEGTEFTIVLPIKHHKKIESSASILPSQIFMANNS